MIFKPKQKPNYIAPWSRVLILVIAFSIILLLARILTGSFLPDDPKDALIFQNALLLVVLGSALLESYYTKPADSLVNALTGIITLISVYSIAPKFSWWGVFGYCFIVLSLATVNTAVSTGKDISGLQKRIAELTYKPAVFLGRARLLFSILFIYGLITFYDIQSLQTLLLILFWGFFIVIWPLGLPELLSSYGRTRNLTSPIGQVIRTEWPNIVRAIINKQTDWGHDSPKLLQQPDGTQSIVITLYSQIQGEDLIGTALTLKTKDLEVPGLVDNYIFDLQADLFPGVLAEALGGGKTSQLIGFMIENSSIAEIKFETWATDICREGLVVWSEVGNQRVYYQIIEGSTKEETFQSHRQGFQIATAIQLGKFDKSNGFVKIPWLPEMNSPIFVQSGDFEDNLLANPNDFVYGKLPGTNMSVRGPFSESMEHHTAILGVTGSGKTEFGYDLIRDAVKNDIKVICIDLTYKYSERLADLKPRNLSLSEEHIQELDQKLFDVEVGKFKAEDEKKALRNFFKEREGEVEKALEDFLVSKESDNKVAIISLEEVANTMATLSATELYLTNLFRWVKNNQNISPRVLVVVEEAHTAMPEPSQMGWDFRSLVTKVSQLALQGRKYGIGLLVIAQRTATVSKSVLTQCNTIVSFGCFDETSLNFLSNIFGPKYISMIPDLPNLNAIMYGKAIRSERPVIVEIPFDEEKAKYK